VSEGPGIEILADLADEVAVAIEFDAVAPKALATVPPRE
jgi:hypothetical protein